MAARDSNYCFFPNNIWSALLLLLFANHIFYGCCYDSDSRPLYLMFVLRGGAKNSKTTRFVCNN